MKHPKNSMVSRGSLRLAPALAVALGSFALASGRAHAGVLKPITISAPAARVVGYDPATDAPIRQITIRAAVRFNPVILTTHSGVSILKDDVAEAARKACNSLRPLGAGEACIRRAVDSAEPQVKAAITRARSSVLG